MIRIIFYFLLLIALPTCAKKNTAPQDQLYCEIDGVSFQSTNMQVQYSKVGAVTSLEIYAYNAEKALLYLKVYALTNALTTHFISNQSEHNLAYATAGNLNNGSTTYQARINCVGVTSSFIQITDIENYFASGAFEGKICLPNGQFKTIRNGTFNQVRLP